MGVADRCPKHDVPMLVRRNLRDGTVELACLLCDVEAGGGKEAEIAALKRGFDEAMKKLMRCP
jgi:hypothetical protein